MDESLFSPLWYRCARLKPQLRPHARVHRHEYRDEIWFMLQDPSSGRFHRATPAAYHLIGLMDGERTVEELWALAQREMGDEAPTQGELIRLLGNLHTADILRTDAPPDVLEMLERYRRHQRSKWKQRLASPLSIRIPMFDPERFLVRWLWLVRPLFGWFGVVLWLAVVCTGTVLAASHWTELTEGIGDRVFSAQNLLLLWLVYPAVKLVHELGHAFATKRWGGEVHELGIMLLVLMPVPYVEASAATAFRDKRKRMLVGAAGILVELFLAALAMIVWVNAQTGLVSAMAYNVMLIGGVSTLLFNGNPLLRFDGYYVLADALELPNLATRSKRYLGYLVHRHLFKSEQAKSPATTAGERAWYIGYGVASFVYRMFIMFVIVLFVASQFFAIGVVLAIWAVTTQLVVPFSKSVASLFTNAELSRRRVWTVSAAATMALALVAILTLLPVPLRTMAQGVVWLPEHAYVRAQSDGHVLRLLVEEGDAVALGQPLVVMDDPRVEFEVAALGARVRELEARFVSVEFTNRTQAAVVREERVAAQANLERAREALRGLTVRSPAVGRFVLAGGVHLPGRFVRRGEVIGYVNDDSAPTVRVVVGQEAIGLVRERTERVEARLVDWGAPPIEVTVRREVPAATDRLPAEALGTGGGGLFPVDPRDPSGLRTLEKNFQIDLAMPADLRPAQFGGRVHVRFEHGHEPAAYQWYRGLRQLFLRQFGV